VSAPLVIYRRGKEYTGEIASMIAGSNKPISGFTSRA
jgi:hypothetical protein